MEDKWKTLFLSNMNILGFHRVSPQNAALLSTTVASIRYWAPVMSFLFHTWDPQQFPYDPSTQGSSFVGNVRKIEMEYVRTWQHLLTTLPGTQILPRLQATQVSGPLTPQSYKFLALLSTWAMSKSVTTPSSATSSGGLPLRWFPCSSTPSNQESRGPLMQDVAHLLKAAAEEEMDALLLEHRQFEAKEVRLQSFVRRLETEGRKLSESKAQLQKEENSQPEDLKHLDFPTSVQEESELVEQCASLHCAVVEATARTGDLLHQILSSGDHTLKEAKADPVDVRKFLRNKDDNATPDGAVDLVRLSDKALKVTQMLTAPVEEKQSEEDSWKLLCEVSQRLSTVNLHQEQATAQCLVDSLCADIRQLTLQGMASIQPAEQEDQLPSPRFNSTALIMEDSSPRRQPTFQEDVDAEYSVSNLLKLELSENWCQDEDATAGQELNCIHTRSFMSFNEALNQSHLQLPTMKIDELPSPSVSEEGKSSTHEHVNLPQKADIEEEGDDAANCSFQAHNSKSRTRLGATLHDWLQVSSGEEYLDASLHVIDILSASAAWDESVFRLDLSDLDVENKSAHNGTLHSHVVIPQLSRTLLCYSPTQLSEDSAASGDEEYCASNSLIDLSCVSLDP